MEIEHFSQRFGTAAANPQVEKSIKVDKRICKRGSGTYNAKTQDWIHKSPNFFVTGKVMNAEIENEKVVILRINPVGISY